MTNQALAPKVDIGVRYTTTEVNKCVVCVRTWYGPSDIDNAVPGPVEVKVSGGGTFTVPLTAVGTDNPDPGSGTDIIDRVGYVGSVEVTGIPDFPARIDATVEQAGTPNGTLVTPISLICIPAPGVHFGLPMATCDNFGAAWRGSPADRIEDPQSSGMWTYIMENANNAGAPYAGVMMIDDINGYVDWGWAYDDAVGGTGRKNTNAVTSTVQAQNVESKVSYDYVLFEFLACGMGTVVESPAPEPGLSGEYLPNWWARNESRLWCQHNLPFWFQYGDHEIQDDFGYKLGMFRTSTSFTENYDGNTSDHQAVTCIERWKQGITDSYDPLFKDLQGVSIAASDPDANHWALTLGDVRFVAPDCYWNASGDSGASAAPEMVSVLGLPQVDDLNANMNGVWNIIASPIGYKGLTSPGTQATRGANWPFAQLNPAEFAALNKPDVFVSGDYHHMWAGVDADTTMISSGTITGSQNINNASLSDGNGITMLYDALGWSTDNADKPGAGFGFAAIEMTDTLRAYVVDGKVNNSFNTGVKLVYAGDGEMANLTFKQAAELPDAGNYDMDGSEYAGFDTDQDPAFPGVVKNYGKRHTDIAKLYSDLGKSIARLPGSSQASSKVVMYLTSPLPTGTGDYLYTTEVTPKVGLTSYRLKISWSRTTTGSTIQLYGKVGD